MRSAYNTIFKFEKMIKPDKMVEYEIIEGKEIKFGRNNFIEVARKRAISDEGENEFISISRGYYLEDGTKKWKASIALPKEKEKREEIAELIKSL